MPLALCCAGLLAATSARAGQLETLSQQLQDRDFKVRLSAGLKLGQLGDPRALPVLTDALGDEIGTVRTIAASAIAKLVDRKVAADQRKRAMTELQRIASKDPDAGARQAAKNAVAALEQVERIARPRPTKGAIFVNVEPFTDSSGKVDKGQLAALTEAGRNALLGADATYLVEWPGGKLPSRKALKKSRAKAITVIPTILELKVTDSGKRAEIECKLSLFVVTYPERGARTVVDGKAKLDTSNKPSAIGRARTRCTMDLVNHLMGNRLSRDINQAAR